MHTDVRPWTMGFTGAVVNDLAYWIDEVTYSELDIKSICIPFLGSAKNLSLWGRHDDMDLESWDTQYIVSLIVDALFDATEGPFNIKEPKLRKGWTYENLPWVGITERPAGLIDYIAEEGSDYERLALVTTIARGTFHGRLENWGDLKEGELWRIFQARRLKQQNFLNMPAKFTHHEADFYKTIPNRSYDLLYIDPPKIVTSTDMYSRLFEKVNMAVSAGRRPLIPFDRWTKYDYLGRLRLILEGVDSHYFMLVYTSDVAPGINSLETFLKEYGVLIKKERFRHGQKLDYGLIYER